MSDFPASASLISFFFLLFAFFKHLNNKQQFSTISVKTQCILQDQSSKINFTLSLSIGQFHSKKILLQGFFVCGAF